MEALAAGLPFMTCLGGVPGDLPVVGTSDNASPLVFLRLKMPIITTVGLAADQLYMLSGSLRTGEGRYPIALLRHNDVRRVG